MTDSPHMPQDDWFAKETGPDTRQPEMVSREAVLELLQEWRGQTSDVVIGALLRRITTQVNKL